jgi:uncharacterized membrane protein YedE/YeeE
MAKYRSALLGLGCGLVFAVGLVLSGMTDPARVLGFLDFAGAWDARLSFVMVGAIAVHFSWLRLAPRFQGSAAQALSLAPHAPVTASLVLGAAIFGVGWGMSGYCPGPAVVSLGLGAREGSLFLLAMLGGMALFQAFSRLTQRRDASDPSESLAQSLAGAGRR